MGPGRGQTRNPCICNQLSTGYATGLVYFMYASSEVSGMSVGAFVGHS